MKKLLMMVLLLAPVSVFSKEKIIINEKKLKELVSNKIPSIERINIMVVQSNLERTQYDQKYSPFVNGEARYENMEGKMYSNFNGNVNDPFKSIGISVNQALPVGMDFKIGLYDGYVKSYNYSSSNISNYSQYNSTLEAKLSIDLWRNLLGYSEKSQKLGLKINEQEKLEQAKLEKTKFYNEIRKLYWDLSINNSLSDVYKALIKQAKIQEKNIKKMYRSSVADKGDLARATAVINARRADLLNVEYNTKRTQQQLSNLIPELNNKEIVLDFSNYDKVRGNINRCFNKIKMEKETPFSLSSYTKLIGYKDDKIKANLKSLKRYSDVDIKLEARAASLGFSGENKDSFSDMSDLERRDYSVGLKLSMPFGSSHSNTKENQMKLLKMQHNLEKKEIISNMVSFHNYFSVSLNNLFQLQEQQKEYRDNLEIRVKSMRTKYNQGRITLSELIQDEDSLFESELGLIRTNYNIIALMLDYFSVFNETDCEFNI